MSEVMQGVLQMPPRLWSRDVVDETQRYSVYLEAARKLGAFQEVVEAIRREGTPVEIDGQHFICIPRATWIKVTELT